MVEATNIVSESTPLKETEINANSKAKRQTSSQLKTTTSISRKRIFVLVMCTAGILLVSAAFSLLAPFYPIVAEKKGMSITMTGFVFGVFQLVIFLTAPFFGNYLTILGPKFVYIAGIFIGGGSFILFGLLDRCPSGIPFLVTSVLCRCVGAFGFSGFTIASFAIVSSEFKDSVGFAFAILETGSGIGYMIGPVIGGALYEIGGFGLPFYCVGAAVLLDGVIVYKFLPTTDIPRTKRKGSILVLLRSPMVFVPMSSVFVGLLAMATGDAIVAKHVEPFNLATVVVGFIFVIPALTYSIMSPIYGYLTDTKDIQAPLIVGGNLVFIIGALTMGPSSILPFLTFDVSTVCIGFALMGLSFGCCLVPTMKCMVKGSQELGFENSLDTFALVSGLFNSVSCLGGFIGPIGMGAVADQFGTKVTFTFMAGLNTIVMVVSLVFFLSRYYSRRRESKYNMLNNTGASRPASLDGSSMVCSGSYGRPFPFLRSVSIPDPEARF